MSDQFTEVTTQGWLQRLGGSLVAALIGLILVPVSIVLLYWNEGRAVDAIRALNRGAAAIVEVNAAAVDPQANGKLVHVSGMMQPTTPARDPVFGVTGDGLLRLSRTVEMYQWKEESNSQSTQSVGGSKTTETTYTYQRVWSAQPIVSAQFKVRDGHQNPPMQVRSATFDAGEVKLGAYRVDPSLLNKLATFTPLQAQSAPPAGYQAAGDGFYQGQNPGQPAIGDVRVTFAAIPAQTVSVAAAQSNGVLTGVSRCQRLHHRAGGAGRRHRRRAVPRRAEIGKPADLDPARRRLRRDADRLRLHDPAADDGVRGAAVPGIAGRRRRLPGGADAGGADHAGDDRDRLDRAPAVDRRLAAGRRRAPRCTCCAGCIRGARPGRGLSLIGDGRDRIAAASRRACNT